MGGGGGVATPNACRYRPLEGVDDIAEVMESPYQFQIGTYQVTPARAAPIIGGHNQAWAEHGWCVAAPSSFCTVVLHAFLRSMPPTHVLCDMLYLVPIHPLTHPGMHALRSAHACWVRLALTIRFV